MSHRRACSRIGQSVAALGKTPEPVARLERAPNAQRNASQRRGQVHELQANPARSFAAKSARRFRGAPARFAGTERRPADVEMARVLKTAPLRMASDPSSGAIAHWKHEPLHDVVEPMTDHVSWLTTARSQRMERRVRKISCDWNVSSRGCDRSFRKDQAPDGIFRNPLMSFSSIFRTQRSSALPTKPTPATPIDLLERTAHPDPITSRLLLSAADVPGGQWGPGYAVQASADGSSGHAPAGCAHRLADHVPAGHGWAVADGPAPRHRTLALGQRCGRLARGAGFGCRPVALPLLPRLQGKHRAFTACLAAPVPARAGHEHAARHRRYPSSRSQPRLVIPPRPPSLPPSGS